MTDVATLRRQTAANRIKRKSGTFHGRGAALLRFTVEADVEVLHNEEESEPDRRIARRTLEGWIERNRGYVRWFNTSDIPTGGITHITSEAVESDVWGEWHVTATVYTNPNKPSGVSAPELSQNQ